MAYEKQTWNTGDVITEEKLNHMEDGIATGGGIYSYGEVALLDDEVTTVKEQGAPFAHGDTSLQIELLPKTNIKVIFSGVEYTLPYSASDFLGNYWGEIDSDNMPSFVNYPVLLFGNDEDVMFVGTKEAGTYPLKVMGGKAITVDDSFKQALNIDNSDVTFLPATFTFNGDELTSCELEQNYYVDDPKKVGILQGQNGETAYAKNLYQDGAIFVYYGTGGVEYTIAFDTDRNPKRGNIHKYPHNVVITFNSNTYRPDITDGYKYFDKSIYGAVNVDFEITDANKVYKGILLKQADTTSWGNLDVLFITEYPSAQNQYFKGFLISYGGGNNWYKTPFTVNATIS